MEVDFTPQITIFNNYQGKYPKLINTFIIILKQYIYAAKCLQQTPTFEGFISRIAKWHQIEYQAAAINRSLVKHYGKWEPYVEY